MILLNCQARISLSAIFKFSLGLLVYEFFYRKIPTIEIDLTSLLLLGTMIEIHDPCPFDKIPKKKFVVFIFLGPCFEFSCQYQMRLKGELTSKASQAMKLGWAVGLSTEILTLPSRRSERKELPPSSFCSRMNVSPNFCLDMLYCYNQLHAAGNFLDEERNLRF